jgi:hypothetical protein
VGAFWAISSLIFAIFNVDFRNWNSCTLDHAPSSLIFTVPNVWGIAPVLRPYYCLFCLFSLVDPPYFTRPMAA